MKHIFACLVFFTLLSVAFAAESKKKIKSYPHLKNGVAYWKRPFKALPGRAAYVSVIIRKKNGKKIYEVWNNSWGKTGEERGAEVRKGKTLWSAIISKPVKVFKGTLIDDVFDPKSPKKLASLRGLTRTDVKYYPDTGYVMIGCVCSDYKPGKVPLLPVIFVSKTGKPGTWKYLGKLKGEPAEFAKKHYVWSDGGSIIRLKNGRWRFYHNGYGKNLSAMESDSIEGPWKFIRDKKGNIKELASVLPLKEMRGKAIFPVVLKASEDEWHAWFSDQWVPEKIYHLSSENGLDWKLYRKQPEITINAFNGKPIKCIRVFFDPDKKRIISLVSVWEKQKSGGYGFTAYTSKLSLNKRKRKK